MFQKFGAIAIFDEPSYNASSTYDDELSFCVPYLSRQQSEELFPELFSNAELPGSSKPSVNVSNKSQINNELDDRHTLGLGVAPLPPALKFKSLTFMFKEERDQVRLKFPLQQRVRHKTLAKLKTQKVDATRRPIKSGVSFNEIAEVCIYEKLVNSPYAVPYVVAKNPNGPGRKAWLEHSTVYLLTGQNIDAFLTDFSQLSKFVVTDRELALKYWTQILKQGCPAILTREKLSTMNYMDIETEKMKDIKELHRLENNIHFPSDLDSLNDRSELELLVAGSHGSRKISNNSRLQLDSDEFCFVARPRGVIQMLDYLNFSDLHSPCFKKEEFLMPNHVKEVGNLYREETRLVSTRNLKASHLLRISLDLIGLNAAANDFKRIWNAEFNDLAIGEREMLDAKNIEKFIELIKPKGSSVSTFIKFFEDPLMKLLLLRVITLKCLTRFATAKGIHKNFKKFTSAPSPNAPESYNSQLGDMLKDDPEVVSLRKRAEKEGIEVVERMYELLANACKFLDEIDAKLEERFKVSSAALPTVSEDHLQALKGRVLAQSEDDVRNGIYFCVFTGEKLRKKFPEVDICRCKMLLVGKGKKSRSTSISSSGDSDSGQKHEKQTGTKVIRRKGKHGRHRDGSNELDAPDYIFPEYFKNLTGFFKNPLSNWVYKKMKWMEIFMGLINSGVVTAMIAGSKPLLTAIENIKIPRCIEETSLICCESHFQGSKQKGKVAKATEGQFLIVRKGPQKHLPPYHFAQSYLTRTSLGTATQGLPGKSKPKSKNRNKASKGGDGEDEDDDDSISGPDLILGNSPQPASGDGSEKVPIHVNASSVLLNTIVRADLYFSRRRHACDAACNGHKGHLLALMIKMGRLDMVKHCVINGVKPSQKMCLGPSRELHWDLTEDERAKIEKKKGKDTRKFSEAEISAELDKVKVSLDLGFNLEEDAENPEDFVSSLNTPPADEVELRRRERENNVQPDPIIIPAADSGLVIVPPISADEQIKKDRKAAMRQSHPNSNIKHTVLDDEIEQWKSNHKVNDGLNFYDDEKVELVSRYKSETPLSIAVEYILTDLTSLNDISLSEIAHRRLILDFLLTTKVSVLQEDMAAVRACVPLLETFSKAVLTRVVADWRERKGRKQSRTEELSHTIPTILPIEAREMLNMGLGNDTLKRGAAGSSSIRKRNNSRSMSLAKKKISSKFESELVSSSYPEVNKNNSLAAAKPRQSQNPLRKFSLLNFKRQNSRGTQANGSMADATSSGAGSGSAISERQRLKQGIKQGLSSTLKKRGYDKTIPLKQKKKKVKLLAVKIFQQITDLAVDELHAKNVKASKGYQGHFATLVVKLAFLHRAIQLQHWDVVRLLVPYRVDPERTIELEIDFKDKKFGCLPNELLWKEIDTFNAEVLKRTVDLLLKESSTPNLATHSRIFDGIFFIMSEYNVGLSPTSYFSLMENVNGTLGFCSMTKPGDDGSLKRLFGLKQIRHYLGLINLPLWESPIHKRQLGEFAYVKRPSETDKEITNNKKMRNLKASLLFNFSMLGFYSLVAPFLDLVLNELSAGQKKSLVADLITQTYTNATQSDLLLPECESLFDMVKMKESQRQEVYEKILHFSLINSVKDEIIQSQAANKVETLIAYGVKPKHDELVKFIIRALSMHCLGQSSDFCTEDDFATDLSLVFLFERVIQTLFNGNLSKEKAEDFYIEVMADSLQILDATDVIWFEGLQLFKQKAERKYPHLQSLCRQYLELQQITDEISHALTLELQVDLQNRTVKRVQSIPTPSLMNIALSQAPVLAFTPQQHEERYGERLDEIDGKMTSPML